MLFASAILADAQTVFPPPTGWRSEISTDHPLVGKIIATEKLNSVTEKLFGADIDYQSLIAKLADAPAVLLGEVHDNPDHHALQGWAASQIALTREQLTYGLPSGAAVFEYFRADQQKTLDTFTASRTTAPDKPASDVADFKRALDWKTSGWPDVYDPLFESVMRERLPLFAGDVPKASIKRAAKEGAGALPSDAIARLKLDTGLGDGAEDAMAQEILDSHCGMLPVAAVANMSFAQRYRDAQLADVILTAVKTSGSATLFAGNGHIRSDRAVPWYLSQRAPEMKVLSVAFVEVEDGKTDVAGYVPRDAAGKPAVDFIFFTPRPQRADPCEGMTEMMGNMLQKAPASSPQAQPSRQP